MALFDGLLVAHDAYFRRKTKRVEIVAATESLAETAMASYLSAFEGVSDAGVEKTSVAVVTPQVVAPESGANIDTGCTLRVRMDNGKIGTIKFPCPKADIFQSDGSVDMANEAVNDIVDLFRSGGAFRLSEGNYVVEFLGGELDR
jgi:hypothetical protein